MSKLLCASIDGFDAITVEIESTFTKGLPSFSIVGLGNTAIQESKDRIKSSLLTNDFKFPPKRITINLSPSEVVKKGSHLDCAMALLIATNDKNIDFKDFYVFGELGLDGKLKDTASIFILILSLAKEGKIKNVLIPKESIPKISTIPNLNIYAVDNLNEAIEFFSQDNKSSKIVENKKFDYKYLDINNKKYYYDTSYYLDFLDVKGQNIAKRAALISAAGNHNILLEGNPGCGKSMITKRLQYIMPPMSLEEILDKAKMDSFELKEPSFKPHRAFVSPHHSSTKASIIGGTKIGEIALCNNGILFFDELPHFSKTIIEALREPLEDHSILVSRVNTKIKYETKFLFISAMNPCPCGNLLSKTKECRCTQLEVQRYKSRISDPFLDRIDLYIIMNEVNSNDKANTTSKELHEKVLKAFSAQKQRGQKELNGKLNEKDIEKFCKLDIESNEILQKAIDSFSLTFRSINKILKVSRTIADIENEPKIQKNHLLEALSYRKR
ncbi:MAG TPA: ATP-binding protein [Arcobacter sp.]|nr:ATP-binding protein [Arcobacter sp.]